MYVSPRQGSIPPGRSISFPVPEFDIYDEGEGDRLRYFNFSDGTEEAENVFRLLQVGQTIDVARQGSIPPGRSISFSVP